VDPAEDRIGRGRAAILPEAREATLDMIRFFDEQMDRAVASPASGG